MYEHVLIYHHGVGIDLLLQSCCSQCYAIQPVHHVLHECVVGFEAQKASAQQTSTVEADDQDTSVLGPTSQPSESGAGQEL